MRQVLVHGLGAGAVGAGYNRTMRVRLLVPFAVLVLAACNTTSEPRSAAPAETAAAAPAPVTPAPAAGRVDDAAPTSAPADGTLSGTIAETMNSGGYTYVRLKRENDEVWVAAREFTAAVGEPLQVAVEMTMRDFKSPTLNRSFPLLYFAAQVAKKGETLKPSAPVSPVPANTPQPLDSHSDRGVAPSPAPAGKNPPVAKVAPPPGGLAIAEVFARKATLSGKPVVVRGTVVKFNGGILDRNWLHLQDGSGSADAQNHDLTITTDAAAARPQVGDVITVSGVLGLKKDFGAGYAYDAILENARIETAAVH